MPVYGFDYLGVDQELVHLVDGASLLFVLVMLRMLIVDIAIFRATLLDKADAIEMMMMKNGSR